MEASQETTHALLIGPGKFGLGCLGPLLTQAGYRATIAGRDHHFLKHLQNGYTLKTPTGNSDIRFDHVVHVDDIRSTDPYDIIFTCVHRNNLPVLVACYEEKGLSTPVCLAENLPTSIKLFTCQIPIVADRICTKREDNNGRITVFAEDYSKVTALDHPLTRRLGSVPNVELMGTEAKVEERRQEKLLIVNTSHLLLSLYGQISACSYVHEAASMPEISNLIRAVVLEISPCLNLSEDQAEKKAHEITTRFTQSHEDPLERILNPANYRSAVSYFEAPMKSLSMLGLTAPRLQKAHGLLCEFGLQGDKADS